LLSAVDDPDPEVRRDILHAIACDRCKVDACTPTKEQVLAPAIQILKEDPDSHVRAMAAEVVGKWVHEDTTASDALMAAHRFDPDASVRKKAGWYAPGGPIYEKTTPKVRRVFSR